MRNVSVEVNGLNNYMLRWMCEVTENGNIRK